MRGFAWQRLGAQGEKLWVGAGFLEAGVPEAPSAGAARGPARCAPSPQGGAAGAMLGRGHRAGQSARRGGMELFLHREREYDGHSGRGDDENVVLTFTKAGVDRRWVLLGELRQAEEC